MSDKPEEKRPRWGSVGCIALVLLIFYPLSLEPVAFLAGTGLVSDTALGTLRPVYVPLLLVGQVALPLESLLIRYDRACYSLGLAARK